MRTAKLLNKQLLSLLLGGILGLGACSVANAMSTLVAITVQPEWPATNDPGNVVLYTVTVTRIGEGDLTVALTSAGLPDGAVGSFTDSLVRFTGNVPLSQTTTLTVVCTNLTATDAYPFTVTGTADRESVTVTNPAAATFDAAFAGNPASRPTLNIDLLGKHNLKVRGKGATGRIYKIEASPVLINPAWGPLGVSKADGNGRFSYLDANRLAPDAYFYRSAGPVTK